MPENNMTDTSRAKEHILSMFDYKPFNNHTINSSNIIGIFTKDYHKAVNVIMNIKDSENYITKHNISMNRIDVNILNTLNYTLTNYIWLKPIMAFHGYRFKGAYIDSDLYDNDLLYDIVLPCCVFCIRENITII